MKQRIFKLLAALNRRFLPSLAQKDLSKLTGWQKLLAAYRYWVTTRALE